MDKGASRKRERNLLLRYDTDNIPVIKKSGTAVPSIVQKILSSFPENTADPDEDLYIELTAATLFAGEKSPSYTY